MHDKIYADFGTRLSNIRKRAGLTQSEVASKLNTVQSTYSGYELGTRKVTLDLIKKLSEIFDVSPDYLVLGQNSESYKNTANDILPLCPEECKLIIDYRNLSNEGKASIKNQMILHLNTYKKDEDISDEEGVAETA